MQRRWIDRIAFLAVAAVVMLVSTTVTWQLERAPELAKALPLNQEERALYGRTVGVLLQEDLWTERDMYDAGHYLMVPMHYAFLTRDMDTMTAFSDFFARFTEDISTKDRYGFMDYAFLHRLQFFYLSTQYMKLCAANGYDSLIPAKLPQLAQSCAETYLFDTEANWLIEPTVIEHIRQVIAGKTYAKHYHSGISDHEFFSLAILCDLKVLAAMEGTAVTETMDLATDLSYQLFSSSALNQETEQGGWLFQVGVWSDHKDFAYAGHPTVGKDLSPSPRDDIVMDSSHFHRMPLLLDSFQSAQPDEARQALFELRKEQLANQLVNYVLKKVDGYWMASTFMDGTNGVFNYSSDTGTGSQGYELSTTFLYGWWAFLNDPRITKCYQETLQNFPRENQANPYISENMRAVAGREQNPFFGAGHFDAGMFECMVMCAEKLQ